MEPRTGRSSTTNDVTNWDLLVKQVGDSVVVELSERITIPVLILPYVTVQTSASRP